MTCSSKSVRVALGMILLAAFVSAASAVPDSQTMDGIEVRFFATGKKVIPSMTTIGGWRIVDVKLPDLVLTNRGKTAVTLGGVEIIGKVAVASAVSMQLSGKDLLEAIRATAHMLNVNRPPILSLQMSYGDVVIPDGFLSENVVLEAGQSMVIPLSKASYLHYIGHSTLDAVDAVLTLKEEKEGGRSKRLTLPIRLTPYEVKGKYVFPLKGNLHLAFLPLSYIHHRGSHSQEFAMDVVGAVQKGAASYLEISTPNPKKLADYGIWGADILAMGDGTVAVIGDKFPEVRMSDPAVFSAPGYTATLLKELSGTIGFTNAVAGNYVVIDHGNGEFSVYCHMKEGSLRVNPGDKVKKSQVIGQVGNTGNSGAPHLHFQLMDSADFLTANGLPMMFENVPNSSIIAEFPVQTNNLSFSDNLFIAVP